MNRFGTCLDTVEWCRAFETWIEEEAAVAAAAAMWWLGALEKDAVAVEDATRVAIVAVIGLALLKGSAF